MTKTIEEIKRENFINRIIDSTPTMKVLWIDKVTGKKWSVEKVITDLIDTEKQQFNLRKQFSDEIILDIEEKHQLDNIAKQLIEKGLSYEVWDTGSRGLHISIKFVNLSEHSLILRNRIRKYIINLYNCDEQLAKESQWVACEHKPHFKTGKAKTLIDTLNQNKPNIIEKEIIDYCVNDLKEKQQRKEENKTILTDYYKTDPYLKYVLTHTIENGDRNSVLFKNFAIALVQCGLEREKIKEYAIKIVSNCPGKSVGEFMGWVDKAHMKELTDYNKSELIQWSIQFGHPILYKLESDEELINLLTIKQLWDAIWKNKIACQDVWRDLCFYNLIGTILDEKEDDLRVHVIFSSYSSTGKDEGINVVQDILERLQYKTRRPATVTDRTLVGAVNQSKIDFNVKHSLSEENPESKGKTYQDPVEVGWLATDNWIAFSEAEFILKPSPHNRHIQIILRQAMDKSRRVEKGVGGYGIPLITNTAFILTTYKMDNIINSVLHNGLFQRTLFYNKELSDMEHGTIRTHINKHRFNNETKIKFNEVKYIGKFLEKLRLMKKWYIENKKNIIFETDADTLVENMWKDVEKNYKYLINIDKIILDSMVRRLSNNLYKLTMLYAVWNMKPYVTLRNIKDCFALIMNCLDSIKGMVLSQDKGKKRMYGVLYIINQMGSIPKMELHYELEKKFKIKSSATRSDFIKKLISLEFISMYKDGRNDMLTLTEKGRNYLAYEE